MWEYLFDCEECLCLNFLSFVTNTAKLIEYKNNDNDDSKDCWLDEEKYLTKIFEFVTIPSFVALIPCNTSDPVHFIKIVDKNEAKENLREWFGHEIFPEESILFAEE